MRIQKHIQLTICLAVVLSLPTLASAQQSTRILRAGKSMLDELDPSSIESEEIDSTARPNINQPVFKQASTPFGSTDKNQKLVPPKSTSNNFGVKVQNQGMLQPSAIGGQQVQPSFLPNEKPFPSSGIVNNNIATANKKNGNLYATQNTPTIQTQISAPRSTIINQPARFFIEAINVGKTNVSVFKLIATLPDHATFVNSNPQPTNVDGRRYEFTFNGLNVRNKQNIQLDLMPTEKLPLNIETQIQIESQQQFAVAVQQPVLEVSIDSPMTIQTGKTVKHSITVTNIGDGVAEGVRIEANRPQEMEVGSEPQKTLVPKLVPGQSTKFVLSSYAIREGQSDITFQVSARGAETKQANAPVRIIRPELGVQVFGPGQNYIGREGIYTIQLENTSEMPITQVAVQLQVPNGLVIDTISQQAKINKNNGTLSWTFPQIPGNQKQVIQFRAKSVAVGNQICKVAVQTKETASREMQLQTQVLGRADLSIRVTDSGAPVGIGNKSDFVIEIANHGSQNAEQVEVRVELPGALMPVNQPGYSVDPSGNFITFDNVSVEAGKRKTFTFKVVAVTEGEHIVRGTVTLQGSTQTISSENSIFVFEAENAKVSDALVPDVIRR